MFRTRREAGVLAFRRPDTTWLSTGWRGGRCRADAAHSVTVPEGWQPADLAADVDRRLAAAGWERDGPVLLTGVDAAHARGARLDGVVAYATAGLSNPAALPMESHAEGEPPTGAGRAHGGTVNVLVGTTRALADGALANLVAVAAEAKAATLLDAVGVPGTTSDAVVVASDPAGEPAEYSGSATAVGGATRACVREAVRASLAARYDDEAPPDTVAAADHGVVTDRRAEVFAP